MENHNEAINEEKTNENKKELIKKIMSKYKNDFDQIKLFVDDSPFDFLKSNYISDFFMVDDKKCRLLIINAILKFSISVYTVNDTASKLIGDIDLYLDEKMRFDLLDEEIYLVDKDLFTKISNKMKEVRAAEKEKNKDDKDPNRIEL